MIKKAIAVLAIACLCFGTESYAMTEYPIGIRLSNPGNIEKSIYNDWVGTTRLQDHDRFVRFDSPKSGIRALAKILLTYKKKHNCETITDIISRYAPPNENNTHSYIRDVSARSGFFPNEILDMGDIFTLVRISQAIIVHENGIAPSSFPPAWYEEQIYIRAVEAALED